MANLRSFLEDYVELLGDLGTPLRALVVSLLGVYLAWQWFNGRYLLIALISVPAVLIGVGLERWGYSRLPKDPAGGLRRMEFLMLTPAVLAALAAGAVVVLSVELSTDENTPVMIKQLIASLSAGIVAFLSSSFISWTGDQKDSRIADLICKNFRRKYKRRKEGAPPEPGVHYFKPESAGERWVYSEEFKGVTGWGGSARRKRARGIAEELANGTSEP